MPAVQIYERTFESSELNVSRKRRDDLHYFTDWRSTFCVPFARDWLTAYRNHHTRWFACNMWKKGAPPPVVLSHSARLNAKKFARVTDETHPAELGRPASNYNVSRHYGAGKRDRFSCDFRRDRARNERPRGPAPYSHRKPGENAHRPFIVRADNFQSRPYILTCRNRSASRCRKL